MRYFWDMSSFAERTAFEAGFASHWDTHLASEIQAARHQLRRRGIFALVITGIGVGLIGIVAAIWWVTPDFGPRVALLSQPLFPALVAGLAALAVIGSWVPLIRKDVSLESGLELALAAHISAVMTPDENDKFAELVVQDLAAADMLSESQITISNHYSGCRAQRRLRLFYADLNLSKPAKGFGARSRRQVTIMRISLPVMSDGEICIDSDIARLADIVRSSYGHFARRYIDHDAFDMLFGVITSEKNLVEKMLPPDFVGRLLALHHDVVNALAASGDEDAHMLALLADASLTLAIDTPPTPSIAVHGITEATVEAEARRRIRQVAALVQLADDLPTGDAIPLPADVGRRPPVAAMQVTS